MKRLSLIFTAAVESEFFSIFEKKEGKEGELVNFDELAAEDNEDDL